MTNSDTLEYENLVVNCLYIGETLQNLELLTLYSFVDKGHVVHLWIYDPIKTKLPEKVILQDANKIIPKKEVFSYKNHDPHLKHGKGSLAGFSDLFRYKLLYEIGGWWIDMDVTCMKKLEIKEPYYFKGDSELPARGNLMKCPKGSELMKLCYEQSVKTINENNTDWMKPIKILNDNIEKLELSHYIQYKNVNLDNFQIIWKYLNKPVKLNKNLFAIHWMNECWRTHSILKNEAVKNSVYGQLLSKYQLPFQEIQSTYDSNTKLRVNQVKLLLVRYLPKSMYKLYLSLK